MKHKHTEDDAAASSSVHVYFFVLIPSFKDNFEILTVIQHLR
jgi:hypothetical protein